MGTRGLTNGLCWSVGSDEKTSIRENLWLLESVSYRLNNNISIDGINYVLDLIDAQIREWKGDLIVNTFPKVIANRILEIPLEKEANEDLMVWSGEPSREFSIRSTYKLLQKGTSFPNATHIQNDLTNFYKKIWKLQIPTKIKITM